MVSVKIRLSIKKQLSIMGRGLLTDKFRLFSISKILKSGNPGIEIAQLILTKLNLGVEDKFRLFFWPRKSKIPKHYIIQNWSAIQAYMVIHRLSKPKHTLLIPHFYFILIFLSALSDFDETFIIGWVELGWTSQR